MGSKLKKNDCHLCPHSEKVAGSSHHIKCNTMSGAIAMLTAMAVQSGKVQTMTNGKTGEVELKFNQHGVKNGWCNWPINFDPIWVECYLKVLQKEKEDGD